MSAAQPFSPRAAVGLVVAGTVAFLVLLYAIGAGLTGGGNDGGNHALAKGLAGHAALAALAREAGFEVEVARGGERLDDVGLLILTPPANAEGAEIERIVAARRAIGPTLVVAPKWLTLPAGEAGKTGWVALAGAVLPSWEGFADDVTVSLGQSRGWRAREARGSLPDPRRVEAGEALALTALVRDDRDRILAAFRRDEGFYPRLDALAGVAVDRGGDDTELYPLILVFEPDLLNNYGLRDRATALYALRLLREASDGGTLPIVFDVTLNGLGRGRNLLTLAFSPPFVAATVVLLMAASVAAWRAFVRFGPPRVTTRGIAHGKAALVESSAGLIRRAGRMRLLGPPYAALVAHRVLHSLGLPATSDQSAIDAAQVRRGQAGPLFTAARDALATARKPHDLVRHAAALHAIERSLQR